MQELLGNPNFLRDLPAKCKKAMVKDHIKDDARLSEYDPTIGDVCYRFSLEALNRFFDKPELCYSLMVYFWAKGRELPDETFLNRCSTTPDFDYVYRLMLQKAFDTLEKNPGPNSLNARLLKVV